MLVSDIITLARDWTGTDSNQYPDAKALRDFNIVYRLCVSNINQDVNQDLFADYFTSNLVKGQSEYEKPQTINSVPVQAGMTNLLGVSVNYTAPTLGTGTVSGTSGTKVITGSGTSFTNAFVVGNNVNVGSDTYKVISVDSDTQLSVDKPLSATYSASTYYVHPQNWYKCRPERASNLEMDQDWYRTNQPSTDPFFIMYDTGIFIYPVPFNDVPFGYRVYATKDPYDLGLSDTPIIDDNWHYVLALGMKPYVYAFKQQHQESQLARQEFYTEMENMLNTISDVQLTPFLRQNDPLTQFQ